MRISFSRTGGFAGVRLSCTLDTTALPADEAARVHHLVAAAGLDALGPWMPEPDRLEYRLEVDGRTFTFGERQVGPALRPLVESLLARARG